MEDGSLKGEKSPKIRKIGATDLVTRPLAEIAQDQSNSVIRNSNVTEPVSGVPVVPPLESIKLTNLGVPPRRRSPGAFQRKTRMIPRDPRRSKGGYVRIDKNQGVRQSQGPRQFFGRPRARGEDQGIILLLVRTLIRYLELLLMIVHTWKFQRGCV